MISGFATKAKTFVVGLGGLTILMLLAGLVVGIALLVVGAVDALFVLPPSDWNLLGAIAVGTMLSYVAYGIGKNLLGQYDR